MLLGGTVAVNANDEPVGFIYIYEINDVEDTEGNGAYVYPVIVYKDWQHHGVARALIDDAVKRYGAIKLVACAESQGFYPKAGFKPMDWSGVAGIIAKDCETCADLKTCHPQPFIRR
jgi:GNAT superfamily N-acetyltransferase